MADTPKPISLRLDAETLAKVNERVDGGDRTAWIKGAIRMRLAADGRPPSDDPHAGMTALTGDAGQLRPTSSASLRDRARARRGI